MGGASGGGSVGIFYTELITEGNISANGGQGGTVSSMRSGNGGNGSIVLAPWTIKQVVRHKKQKFSKSNWAYLFTEYVSRLSEEM